MRYKCKLCKFLTVTRKQMRDHIRTYHKEKWRELCKEKNELRRQGKPFRHGAPLSDLYEVL
jgi:hypothetical protein